MSKVTLAPYVLTDADGSDPRIMIPVKTPAALVMIESRSRGSFVAQANSRDGVPIALDAARGYVRSHRTGMERLYAQMDRIRSSSGPGAPSASGAG